MSSTAHVYSYEPIAEKMNEDQAKLVLGTQGQLWTEYIPTYRHLQYMAFPRACALSEVAWLEKDKKNMASFLQRFNVHRKRLEVMGINAHPQPRG